MKIDMQILNAKDSWKHQLDVYRGYHEKYASIYCPVKTSLSKGVFCY